MDNPFTNLFPTKREPFQLVSDKIYMELVLDYTMEPVVVIGMNGPKFDLMQSPKEQPAYEKIRKKNQNRTAFN